MTNLVLASVHTKTLSAPDTGTEDKVYGVDYVSASSHTVTASMATSKLLGRTTAATGSPEEISVGAGLALAAGALTCTVAPVSDIIFAAAGNTDFDLTNGGLGGAVTIISKSVTGISAGDRISMEIDYTVLNNSGGVIGLTPTVALGTLSTNAGEINTLAASATARSNRKAWVTFAVSATNLGYAQFSQLAGAPTNSNTAVGLANAASTNISIRFWNSSTNDNTGTQTVSFTVSSSTQTTTQTLTLHSYIIRKVSTI